MNGSITAITDEAGRPSVKYEKYKLLVNRRCAVDNKKDERKSDLQYVNGSRDGLSPSQKLRAADIRSSCHTMYCPSIFAVTGQNPSRGFFHFLALRQENQEQPRKL